jgi:hypothetical protein
MTATEIECPICDRKVQSDMDRCPNCGANLTLSSFEDLEEVARDLSTNKAQGSPDVMASIEEPAKTMPKAEEKRLEAPVPKKKEEPKPPEEPKKEEKATIDHSRDESKHGIGRLFGKKKR